MEYYINVYQAGVTMTEVEFSKKEAMQDLELTTMSNVLSHWKYIHTIHVTDDQALVIDLRGRTL